VRIPLAILLPIVLSACGQAATTATQSPPTSHLAAPSGSIAGRAGYPSEGVPPMTIYAIPVAGSGSTLYTSQTIKNQGNYTIVNVPAGTYEVYAAPSGALAGTHFMAAYTKDVPCGYSTTCTDHSVIPVVVRPGQAVTGIDPDDFYAPPDSFRVIPAGGPSFSPVPSPQPAYADAAQAARYEAQRGTGTTHIVDTMAHCRPNQACAALGQSFAGTRAAYFVGGAGSNTNVKDCAFYVFQDTAGWHPLNTACGAYAAPGRTVSASFMGSGCINVRQSPGYTNRILECIPVDTKVSIDGGPVFVQEASPSDSANLNRLWWHLAGHGWMVHQYLTFGDFD
jgi:hypothetical protein